MAKGILVVDMPESCNRCDCCSNSFCYAPNVPDHDVVEYARSKTKPAWCPLKPMPERQDTAGETVASVKGYMVGWNACIDAITGKGKQGENDGGAEEQNLENCYPRTLNQRIQKRA